MARRRLDADTRLLSKISKLYYQQGCTQHEIAARLHLSRPKVSRLLQQALDEGIVQINVLSPPGIYADLEETLERRYGLQEALVIDSYGTQDTISREIGLAAAGYLERSLDDNETLGMTWGSTLHHLVHAMQPLERPGAHVVQVIGGLGSPEAEVHATELCRRMAHLLGSRLTLLPAPGIVGSRNVKEAISADRHVRPALDLLDRLTTVVAGIGVPEPDSVLLRDGSIIGRTEVGRLLSQGAVGDIALRFFDAAGRPVQTEIDERVIGISLEQLRHVARVVGVAGGPHKRIAVRAALEGGLVDVLITDQATAAYLAEPSQEEQPEPVTQEYGS